MNSSWEKHVPMGFQTLLFSHQTLKFEWDWDKVLHILDNISLVWKPLQTLRFNDESCNVWGPITTCFLICSQLDASNSRNCVLHNQCKKTGSVCLSLLCVPDVVSPCPHVPISIPIPKSHVPCPGPCVPRPKNASLHPSPNVPVLLLSQPVCSLSSDQFV